MGQAKNSADRYEIEIKRSMAEQAKRAETAEQDMRHSIAMAADMNKKLKDKLMVTEEDLTAIRAHHIIVEEENNRKFVEVRKALLIEAF